MFFTAIHSTLHFCPHFEVIKIHCNTAGRAFSFKLSRKKEHSKPGPLKMRVVSCRDKCKVVFQLETDLFTTQYLNFTNVYLIFVRTTMFCNYKDLSFSC